MKRERLGSRMGFIMLSAGCAIGCGNVWKFPWMCGQYGGGSFILVYLLCLIFMGLPSLVMEFAVGRAAQTSPIRMFRKLETPGQKWHVWSWVCLAGNVFLMAFYAVVTGWIIYYFVKFLTGTHTSFGFGAMISDPGRITKYMMTGLLVLMVILAVHCVQLEGAFSGLEFYLKPDFSKITGAVVVAAMNQAFFTLSTGQGGMAIFGSYIGKDRSLMGESVRVILLVYVYGLVTFNWR